MSEIVENEAPEVDPVTGHKIRWERGVPTRAEAPSPLASWLDTFFKQGPDTARPAGGKDE